MILYFSGTGNTAYAAKQIAEICGDTLCNLAERIRTDDHSPMDSSSPWVLAVPTYAWRVPRVVLDWLRKAELRGSRAFYLVMTCASSSGAAADEIASICGEKGLEYRGHARLIMPENYIVMFRTPDRRTASGIFAKGADALQKTGEAIARGDQLNLWPSTFVSAFLTKVINAGFYRWAITAKPFRAEDKCVSCGLCRQVCPLGNIRLEAGKPVWGDRCTHCMACICRCPKEAIEFGNRTKGRVRYVCPMENKP